MNSDIRESFSLQQQQQKQYTDEVHPIHELKPFQALIHYVEKPRGYPGEYCT